MQQFTAINNQSSNINIYQHIAWSIVTLACGGMAVDAVVAGLDQGFAA